MKRITSLENVATPDGRRLATYAPLPTSSIDEDVIGV
jgi:hypothetical protein